MMMRPDQIPVVGQPHEVSDADKAINLSLLFLQTIQPATLALEALKPTVEHAGKTILDKIKDLQTSTDGFAK